MEIRRSGNFGIIDTGSDKGLISFSIGGRGKGWEPSSIQLNRRGAFFSRKISVNGTFIVPMGDNNDMPGEVMRLLDKFYAGEGIMGKIAGLQWGEGPRLYEDAIDEENNRFYRRWKLDPEITADLESWDYTTVLHRSLVDLTHMQGFFIKFVRNRAPRVGNPGRLVRLEHIPFQKARLVYPPDGEDEPQEVLAGGLAAILIAYNENASAISLHIESPQSYWDRAEARIKQVCERTGEKYTAQMLEDFKDEAMEKFASNITGRQNAGKYMHTTKFWNPEANNFEGWTVEPLDKKIKDYVDAQIKISNKADAAATSGFGLDPVLSNLIIENKLSSGSEKLYSLKVYNASETAIPDMILCKPLQQYINANFPGTTTKVGLYRTIVEAEQNISPSNRMKENA